MALQKRTVDIPIVKGLGQKTDPRLLSPGSFTTLSNAVQDKIGSLIKRPGVVDLGVAARSPWGRSLNPVSNGNLDCRLVPGPAGGIAQINDFRMWKRASLATNDTRAYDLDDVTNMLVQRYGIGTSAQAFTCVDIATDGNKILVTWIAPDSIFAFGDAYYTVLDATTLETLVPPQEILPAGDTAVNFVRISSLAGGQAGSVAAAVWQVGNTLYGSTFTFSTLTWSSSVSFATDCNTNLGAIGTVYGVYDVSLIDASSCAVAYGTTANPCVVNVKNLALSNWTANTSGSVTPPGATGLHIYGVGIIAGSNNHTWVAYAYNSGGMTIRAFALHTSNMATVDVADTTLWTDAALIPWRLAILDGAAGVTSGVIVVGSTTGSGAGALHWASFTTSAAVIAQSRYGLKLSSKPWPQTGKNCVLVSYAENDPIVNGLQVARTYYAVELLAPIAPNQADLRPLATIAPRIGAIPASVVGGDGLSLPAAMPLSIATSNERAITACITIRTASGGVGIDVCDAKFTRALWQSAALGGVTYLSGGIPCAFDGARVTEMGFLFQPPSIGAVPSSTGGSVGPASGSFTYTYAVVYEWRDKTGQRCQSRPTFATATVSTATGSVALSVPPLNLSLRQDKEAPQPPVALAIYRDTATSQGSLVRIFSGDIPSSLQNIYQTANLTYTDTASDTSIAGNEGLYTVGGVLDCVCPSSLSSLIVHRNRLVGIGDDGTTLWFTTQYDGGSTQPYFNDALVVSLPERAVALASMDGHLLAFTATGIYVIDGDGPDSTGSNNTWTIPQRLAVDLGCTSDWRSVVQFHGGVVFQNGSKLYLLSRALEVSLFSGALEDVFAANPIVTSATLHAARNELRFTLQDSETSTTGIVANYNYVSDTWSTFAYYDQDAAAFGAAIGSSLVVGGAWFHASANGRVWQEDAQANGWDVDNAYLTNPIIGTNTHWITASIASAHVKADGVQGFGRFWDAVVMMQSVSPCDVTISLGYDYADSFMDVRTWTASEIVVFATPQPQMKVDCSKQKSESIRVQFSDAAPTGVTQTSGFGANLLSMTLDLGVKGGRFRLPAAQGQ